MDHNFYSLDEAAPEIGCTANDLLKLGAAGDIELCIWYEGRDHWRWGEIPCPLSPPIKEFIPISNEDCMQAYQENKLNPRPGKHREVTLKYKNHSPMLIRDGSYSFAPEFLYISKETFDTLKAELDKAPTKPAVSCLEEEPSSPASVIPGEGILVGWKKISDHLGVSVSTAKRYAKGRGWPKPGLTGKPTTTTTELDKHLRTVSKKKV